MSNFWDTVFQPPTTGETLPPPLNDPFGHLLGTSAGLDTSVNDAGAEAVFPALSPDPNSPNSLIARAGKPNGFDTPAAALSPDVFATWHSAYQAEYINAHKGEQDANGVLTIGAPPAAIHVTLSADQRKVYILESLQKADFAKMALADQLRIAQTQTFVNFLAPQFGLSSNRADPLNTIQAWKNTINDTTGNAGFVSPEDKQVFLEELTIIATQVQTMGVFSLGDINAAINAVIKRFERVAAFAKAVATPVTPSSFNRPGDHFPTQFMNVVSLQSGVLGQARLSLMNAEKQTASGGDPAPASPTSIGNFLHKYFTARLWSLRGNAPLSV
jgi:hypothetical protein